MKYEIPTKSTGYFPEALSLLLSIEDSCIFNEEKDLSHPADIFLLTFNDVIESAYRLAKRYNLEAARHNMLEDVNANEIDDIRIDIFNFIFYTSNFIEACQSIIKSLFPDSSNGKAHTKAAREFNESTKEYRAHTSKIINQIKHQHRRIRPFTAKWDNNLIIGYFIDGLVAKNTIGPEPKIHAKFHDLATGFSINREVPYHLVSIYFVSSCLAAVVRKHAKFIAPTLVSLPGDDLIKCLREVERMRLLFLPDEIKKPVPSIKEKKDDKFTLELSSTQKPGNMKPHIFNISLSMKLGIRNLSFAPPYAIFTNG